MTEYDFSPEAFERYTNTQNRIQQWVGSGQQYPPGNPYGVTPSQNEAAFRSGNMGYERQGYYDDGHRSRRRGRSTSRYQDHHRGGRSRERFHRDTSLAHGRSPSMNVSTPPPQPYGVNPDAHPSFQNAGSVGAGAFAHPMNSRQDSVTQAMSRQGSFIHHSEMPPLPIQQPLSAQDNHIPYSASQAAPLSYQGSHRGYPRAMERGQSHIQVPLSSSGQDRRRYRSSSRRRSDSRSRSRDSYSDYSYSSASYSSRSARSRSQSRHNYRTVHPSRHNPTVIQPSRSHPIVVPIHGGAGGYVVVPPVGQKVEVVDPEKYYRQGQSLIGRILSPSNWGIGRKKPQVYRM